MRDVAPKREVENELIARTDEAGNQMVLNVEDGNCPQFGDRKELKS
jgi:hypothetical protein